MRLLLLEDDPFTGQVIVDSLREQCYAVDWLRSGADALLALQTCAYDLLLLDLHLPERPGMRILASLRSSGLDLPVLIISGETAKSSRIEGLDAGADDYLVKPFEQAELLARVRALLRRVSTYKSTKLTHGMLSLDLATHEVLVDGRVAHLTRREFSVLRALLSQPGSVVRKRDLVEKIYDWNIDIASNTIDVHVCQIRKKLGVDLIETLRGVGYKICLAKKPCQETA